MKHRNLKAACLALVGSLIMAAGASAAPTVGSSVGITGQGPLYKEAKKPVNIDFTANITPAPTDATVTPLLDVNFSLPKDVAFVPDPKMPVCKNINDNNFNFPPDAAIQTCPNSVIGNGTATIILAGALIPPILPPITDPIITIFNGGTAKDGGGILLIHAYSASTNAAVLMTGSIVDGNLNVAIPRLTADSATTEFNLKIPGDLGQTKSYAQASCSTGNYKTDATFQFGNRSETGAITNQSTMTSAATDQACTGLAGSAKLNKVAVSGPSKVKKGKKATYKVKMTNNGTATAKGVRLKVSGKGVSFNTSAGTIAPAKTKTVNVKLKAKKKGKVKLTFKVTTTNDGGKTVKKTITVK